MWKTVFITQSETHAEKIKAMLTANGFLIQVKSSGGKHNKAYEISVPYSEAEDVYEVLCEHKFQG